MNSDSLQVFCISYFRSIRYLNPSSTLNFRLTNVTSSRLSELAEVLNSGLRKERGDFHVL